MGMVACMPSAKGRHYMMPPYKIHGYTWLLSLLADPIVHVLTDMMHEVNVLPIMHACV